MTSPLHAPYLADRACHRAVTVIENVQLARDTYRVRFAAPELARRIVPGQFVMVRLAGSDDPLLGRPFALYDTVEDGLVDIVYLVLGRMTRRLARLKPGDPLEVWGPLGNGFTPTECAHLLMIAGGIGQTPFLALAKEQLGLKRYGDPVRSAGRAKRVTFCYGARNSEYFAGLDDFAQLGIDIRLSTDDGSRGHHGRVTELAAQVLDDSPAAQLVCCGPEPMMEAVAHLAAQRGVACQVSLETPMACGIGICFSCVAKVADDSGAWDYKRTCVEGPVFPAEKIVW